MSDIRTSVKHIPLDGARQRHSTKKTRVWLLRPSKLLWASVIGAIWLSVLFLGTPHLRFRYIWTGNPDFPVYHSCDYVGLHSRRIAPVSGDCPLVMWLLPEGAK